MHREAKTGTPRAWPVVALIGMLLCAALPGQAQEVARERFQLPFGDVTSEAELTYPAEGEGPLPGVVLIPGSGVADMDHTVVSPFEYGPDGPVPLSSIFADIAEYLSQRGFAVLRYNKRHVTGPNQADYQRFYQLSLHEMLDDARVALEAARTHPRVDPDRLFVYGWSEGSTLAAALASERTDLAGLVLQGPVVFPWREGLVYQVLTVGWPYVARYAADGVITPEVLTLGMRGDGGMVAKSVLSYLIDPSFMMTGQVRVNPTLDTDGDGSLLPGSEASMTVVIRIIEDSLAPGGSLQIYAPGEALPPVGDQVTHLDLPVLILQGGRDANVPPWGARLLADLLETAGRADVTLHIYDQLGHSLGPTPDLIQDNFQPIAEEPLRDLVTWLQRVR